MTADDLAALRAIEQARTSDERRAAIAAMSPDLVRDLLAATLAKRGPK